MVSFTSILTAVKGTSLATKVGLSVGVVAIVAGGTVGTIAIVNANKPHEETLIVASNPNDDNPSSEQEDTQIGETGESKDDNIKTEQTANATESTASTDKSQATTQKPSNSTSDNQSNSASSTPKPSTSTAQPPQPSQPSAPSQPAQPAKKPDYNLNDKYVAGYDTYDFYIFDKSKPELQQCVEVEHKTFFGITKFTGFSGDLMGVTIPQAIEYAKSKGYSTECWGAGAAPITWQHAINMGIAHDEEKCAQYGLRCGRW